MTNTRRPAPEPAATEPVLDVHLQMLVQLLGQELRSTLPVTLNVPGGVLHGELISHEAWKASWARDLREIAGAGARMMAVFPETVDQGVEEAGHDGEPDGLPRWIHLRDAVLMSGSLAPLALPLWRARLADVSGWALGRPAQQT
jgi:hypothetical protein